MSDYRFIHLENRKLLRIGGDDATRFLQGLLTCDVEHLQPGETAFGALLSPQGKILFDFFVIASTGGYLLDTDASMADDLARRLTFYKLRSRVTIEPMDERTGVFAVMGDTAVSGSVVADGIVSTDPRLAAMGLRAWLRRAPEGAAVATPSEWHAMRIANGMPEGGTDFSYGEAFPHEALMDQFKGVDFVKGCYVGQEVVSRMQHRGTARKRFIMVEGDTDLPSRGCEILVDGKPCGEITSVAGRKGLALVRLDRAANHSNGSPALAGSQTVRLSIPDWCDFSWPEKKA